MPPTMPPPSTPPAKTSDQYFFSTTSSAPTMANNTWDFYSLSNHPPQSQARPVIRPAHRASDRQLRHRFFTGGRRRPCVSAATRGGGTGSRHLNRFSTVANQERLISVSQQSNHHLQQATASAIRRFLRAHPNPPVAMYAQRRGSRPAAPPPRPPPAPAAQNRPATPEQLNNNVNTAVVRMRQEEAVPDQESETESADQTQPFINQLEHPIENGEFAAEEPVNEEEEEKEDDLTLKL